MDFERVGEVCPNKIVSLEYLYKNIFLKINETSLIND